LKTNAQKETNRADHSRNEHRVVIAFPQKKCGNSNQNYRRYLKDSFHFGFEIQYLKLKIQF
jgi:hypothetical protein